MTQLEPRNHQVATLAAQQRTLTAHDRAQLVMACGTGKTLIGRWHAEQVNAALTLAVVPPRSRRPSTSGSAPLGGSSSRSSCARISQPRRAQRSAPPGLGRRRPCLGDPPGPGAGLCCYRTS
jgi:hypothetical protein